MGLQNKKDKQVNQLVNHKSSLYVGQLDGYTIKELVYFIERILDESTRQIVKENVYSDNYCFCYKIPIYNDEIELYPITQMTVEYVLPELENTQDIPNKLMETLRVIAVRSELGVRASYIVKMPSDFHEQRNIHICKLLITSIGGYFTKIDNLPVSGILDKTEHFYSERLDWQGFDVLDNIEDIIKKYS